jgi:hypothetical protein
VVLGLLAAPFFGPPLFIHIPPWLVGILLVRHTAVANPMNTSDESEIVGCKAGLLGNLAKHVGPISTSS